MNSPGTPQTPPPLNAEFRVELADGTPLVMRPVTPADRERVRTAIENLSSRSRYQRFWTPLGKLDEELLDRLTTADGVNHVVWAALDPETPGYPGLGAASWFRLEDHPGEAEISVTVADEHQGQGLGTLLLATLLLIARRLGIRRFRGTAISSNRQVIEWLQSLGANAEFGHDYCELTMEITSEAARHIPHSIAGDLLVDWLQRLPPLLFSDVEESGDAEPDF